MRLWYVLTVALLSCLHSTVGNNFATELDSILESDGREELIPGDLRDLESSDDSSLPYLDEDPAEEIRSGRPELDTGVSFYAIPLRLSPRFPVKRDRVSVGRRQTGRRSYIGRRRRKRRSLPPYGRGVGVGIVGGWEDSAPRIRNASPGTASSAKARNRGGAASGFPELSTLDDVRVLDSENAKEERERDGTSVEKRRSPKQRNEKSLSRRWEGSDDKGDKRTRPYIGKRGEDPIVKDYSSETVEEEDANEYKGKAPLTGQRKENDWIVTLENEKEKRARSFIGKREDFEDKRARSFIGKREDFEDKRARSFIGKREDFDEEAKRARSFIGKREDFDEEAKRARSFIGKREDFDEEDKRARSFIGKREDFGEEAKRARSFIGKREGFDEEDKRARSFIGKRGDFDEEDKRSRSFIGKREDLEEKRARSFIGKREDFEDKRARSFIGKREDFDEGAKRARSFIGKREDFDEEDKRARSFIGKREDFEDKRARSFIGKRGDFDEEDKRARSFIGKREDFNEEDKRARSFIGKREDFEDKRARSFIGKREDFDEEAKRARSFIGKREDFDEEDKRARSFIGKRDGLEEKLVAVLLPNDIKSDKGNAFFKGANSAEIHSKGVYDDVTDANISTASNRILGLQSLQQHSTSKNATLNR